LSNCLLVFQIFGLPIFWLYKGTWWGLFQKRVVCT
jgi:hypothetical protein